MLRLLTEQWVRSSSVNIGAGQKLPAAIHVILNPDYSIKEAHFQGPDTQKLAEQMIKDTPEGVDILAMKVPKVIILHAGNGWPAATLSLDANNRDKSSGAPGEGDSSALLRYIQSKGLPPATKLTGD